MKKKALITVLFVIIVFVFYQLALKKEVQVSGQSSTTTTTIAESDPELFKLSLGKIFTNHQDLSTISDDQLVTIIMTGDIIPARHVNAKVTGYGDFTHPYLKTAPYLREADLTVTNLESPLIDGCPVNSYGMSFCGDQRHVEGLKFAGIDIASLANNHAGNYGEEGIAETKTLLEQNGIETIGLGRTVTKVIKGTRFTFLAYNGISEHFDEGQIRKDISEARKQADVVVVLPHWGKEYVRIPETSPEVAPEDPRAIGKMMIDAGADIILGNHPHWYQGVEIYKNKLIAYAHGNFIFDQEWSLETKQGVVGKYTFYQGKLVDVTFSPVQIEDYNQSYFLEGDSASSILKIMQDHSF